MTRNSPLSRLVAAITMIALVVPAGTSLLAQTPAPTPTASPTSAASSKPPAAKPAPKPVAKPPAKPRTPADAVTPTAHVLPRHEEFMYRKTEGDIGLLFVGDSITDYFPRRGEWSWLKFAPHKPADFGIGGQRTEHVLWRLLNGELDGINPKVVVLMIGTNNIGQCPDEDPAWAAAGVAKIVETIHAKLPNAKILLLGVFPRDKKDSVLRKKVEEINQIICKLADGNKTRYLDIGKVFLDETGEIPVTVMPDGLHPNAKGYDLWYEAMSPLLTEMLK